MPSFSDSIFLFALALLLFGPKKLPVLARELGKWIGEFRRASNEFKMQMEEELRQVEQADRQKQIAAMEAAAPLAPALDLSAPPDSPDVAPGSPEDPTQREPPSDSAQFESAPSQWKPTEAEEGHPEPEAKGHRVSPESADITAVPSRPEPLPIATSGDLRIMPPSTGLPTPRAKPDPFGGGLLDAIPDRIPDAIPDTSTNHSVAPAMTVATEGEANAR